MAKNQLEINQLEKAAKHPFVFVSTLDVMSYEAKCRPEAGAVKMADSSQMKPTVEQFCGFVAWVKALVPDTPR